MLAGKVSLITGSTSGIGLAVAKSLAAQGSNLILHGLMPKQEGETLANEIAQAFQVQVLFDDADLRDENAIRTMFSRIAASFSSLDILVNNAGIQHTETITQFPTQKWHDIIAINLSSAFFAMQQALPLMQKNQWGRVVNIASVHGLVGSANKSAYVAAKHGIVGLTKVAGLEHAADNITINAICPGWVDTPLIGKQIEQVAERDGVDLATAKQRLITAKQPRPDMATPEQIGQLITFLCSEHAQGITGSAMPVDGGWTAQ